MVQLGGHAIDLSISDSPLGTKETITDTAKVLSRYVNVIMARVKSRRDIKALIQNATVPVINALDGM
jgi:ornithine carbamoyltransferase